MKLQQSLADSIISLSVADFEHPRQNTGFYETAAINFTKIKLPLLLNQAPRHVEISGSGGVNSTHTLNLCARRR
jgi:hypothetical protein